MKFSTLKIATITMMVLIGADAYAFGDSDASSRSGANARASASATQGQQQGQLQGQLQGQGQIQGQGQVGNTTTVQDNSRYEAPDMGDIAPAMGVAGLVASTGTCLGSTSGSVAFQGFGLGGGSTKMDTECNVRFTSIRLAQLGLDNAAVNVMCQSPTAKTALENTGYDCGEDAFNSPAKLPSTTYNSTSFIGGMRQ